MNRNLDAFASEWMIQVESNWVEKINYTISKYKKDGMAILISDKQTLRQIFRDKGTYQNDKGVYSSGRHKVSMHLIRASKYTKQKWTELKTEIEKSTVTFGDFNTLFSAIDRTRQKLVKTQMI